MGEQAVARARDVLHALVEQETVVLDPATGGYTRLNATGTFLWELLSEPTTRAALEERLVRAYGVDPATAGRDVDAFLRMLGERGLLAAEHAG